MRLLFSLCLACGAPARTALGESRSLWLSPAELAALPTSGPAWDALVAAANADWGKPEISDMGSKHDTATLAGALVAARTNDAALRAKTAAALEAAVGTERSGNTLGLGRNLVAYVIAADLIAHRTPRFATWVDQVRFEQIDRGSLIDVHEKRPNNWGTHAGASRIAASLFVGDAKDVARAAAVFHGWTGDRDAYAGFEFRGLEWQSNPSEPVAVNPVAAVKRGRNLDGVLPDDQRRCECEVPASGPFQHENYVWEALQGAAVQAQLLSRASYPAWEWQDEALVRALRWLYDEASYPAEGDDAWLIWLVNSATGSHFPTAQPGSAKPGKNMGFTDWTHAAARRD